MTLLKCHKKFLINAAFFAIYQFLQISVRTIVYVIKTLPPYNFFGDKVSFLAVLFMSTTGIVLKRTLQFFDHKPKESYKGNDDNNIGNKQHLRISPIDFVTKASQKNNLNQTQTKSTTTTDNSTKRIEEKKH